MNTVFISLDNTAEGVDVGYEIKWRDPWEPFFISPRTAPDYDERFKQVRTSIHSSLSTSWGQGVPAFLVPPPVLHTLFLAMFPQRNRDIVF